jgi:hypothetical protein
MNGTERFFKAGQAGFVLGAVLHRQQGLAVEWIEFQAGCLIG